MIRISLWNKESNTNIIWYYRTLFTAHLIYSYSINHFQVTGYCYADRQWPSGQKTNLDISEFQVWSWLCCQCHRAVKYIPVQLTTNDLKKGEEATPNTAWTGLNKPICFLIHAKQKILRCIHQHSFPVIFFLFLCWCQRKICNWAG